MWWRRLIFFGLITLNSPAADACYCGAPESHEQARAMLDNTDAVFVGRVESVDPAAPLVHVETYDQNIVTVVVTEALKGVENSSRERIVWTHLMCGQGFESGDTYLIFVSRREPDGPLWSSGCSVYKYLTTQADELKYAEGMKSYVSEMLSWLRNELD